MMDINELAIKNLQMQVSLLNEIICLHEDQLKNIAGKGKSCLWHIDTATKVDDITYLIGTTNLENIRHALDCIIRDNNNDMWGDSQFIRKINDIKKTLQSLQ